MSGRKTKWQFRVYVAGGKRPICLRALSNLKSLCEQRLQGHYEICIVDLAKQPHLAVKDQIVAMPTVLRSRPLPVVRMSGDCSDIERVLSAFEMAQA